MRKLLSLGALLLLIPAALAGPITLNVNSRFEFTDCAVGGSASQAVIGGSYLLRVTDSDVFLCYAGTCAAGGEKLPQGTVMLFAVQPALGSTTVTMSCRSAGSLGDVILTAGG